MEEREKKIRILAIVGPTASGKSALAVEAAKALGGEIVSCDSMQVYRRMNIGTAKPTPEETGGIPHHLIDCAEPETPYSCAEYVRDAARAIREIDKRGNLPVLCGGTGLYLDRLLCGGGFEAVETDPELRRELADLAVRKGNHALHELLREVDPESADAIHENNVKRVIRALEIYRATGITKSEMDRRSQKPELLYDAVVIGLRYADRAILNGRIDRRVDTMIAAGLPEETKELMKAGVFEGNTTAAQAIGYKELLPYLRGECGLREAAEQLKLATRHYAKRQMTWFSAKEYVHWIDAERGGVCRSTKDLLGEVLERFR